MLSERGSISAGDDLACDRGGRAWGRGGQGLDSGERGQVTSICMSSGGVYEIGGEYGQGDILSYLHGTDLGVGLTSCD